MESRGKSASLYLSVLEIQAAQIGQVELSCLLQLPGKSLGLTLARMKNGLSHGHSRDLQHGGWSAALLQSEGTSSHGWPDQGSTGLNVPLLGRGSTGWSIPQERDLGDTDAVAYGRRKQALWAWQWTLQDEPLLLDWDVCLPSCLPALSFREER